MVRLRFARGLMFGVLSLLVCCLGLGCGSKGYRLSGKVTFKGQPIPSGKIYFIPDASKGNKGPTGYADIKAGAYDTGERGGSGVIGGPMLVKIEGFEPLPEKDKKGEITTKQLFPTYQTAADLPKESTTKDFDVPAAALKATPTTPVIP